MFGNNIGIPHYSDEDMDIFVYAIITKTSEVIILVLYTVDRETGNSKKDVDNI